MIKEIKNIYDSLWDESIDYIRNNDIRKDSFLLNPQNDKRYGITLIAKLNNKITKRFLQVINEIRLIEPNQYYYDEAQIHITILNIISAVPDFIKKQSDINLYSSIIESVTKNINNILIHFSGITISRECIIIKGFPNNNDLNNARDQLREKFFYRKLNVNIDPHYKLITAHSTIARFRDNLNDPTKLVKYLLSIKDFDFGISQIDRFLLVYNDWYMSPSKTKVIGEFLFKK